MASTRNCKDNIENINPIKSLKDGKIPMLTRKRAALQTVNVLENEAKRQKNSKKVTIPLRKDSERILKQVKEVKKDVGTSDTYKIQVGGVKCSKDLKNKVESEKLQGAKKVHDVRKLQDVKKIEDQRKKQDVKNPVETIDSLEKIRCLKISKESQKTDGIREKLLPLVKYANPILKIKMPTKKRTEDDLHHNWEYREDTLKYLLELETKIEWPKKNYMCKQMHLNFSMRTVLVDWLACVADEYKLNEQTFHLSVHYIDKFLSHMSVVRDKFQLLGCAAMLIASKIEEIYPPDCNEWSYLSGNYYTVEQVVRMEQLMLKVLQFDVQPPTMFTFLENLCAEHNIDDTTKHLAMYLSELVLLEGEDYLQYFPSKLAAGCLALARQTLSKPVTWPKKFEESSGYTLKQLSPVLQRQHKSFEDSPTKKQQAIQSKYKSEKYLKVADLKPRTLDLGLFED